MTATETGFGPTDDVADKVRAIDARLDELADRIGGPDAASDQAAIRREARALDAELRVLDAEIDLVPSDDPFSTAKVAIAARKERLGFLRAAAAATVDGQARTSAEPEVEPEALPLPAPDPRRAATAEAPRASRVGRVLSIVGLVVVGFFLYQLTVSALVYDRNQDVLLQQFEEQAPEQALTPDAAAGGGEGEVDGLLTPGDASGEPLAEAPKTEVIAAAEPPAVGDPIGILQIPGIGLEEVVVQGSSPAQLRSGIGHLRGTLLPGEPGNSVLAGSRIANGAPFRNLDDLRPGDEIRVATAVGRFDYEVRTLKRVRSGDEDPVRASTTGGTLTLVTSTPAFFAYDRLVAVADLKSIPVAPRFKPTTPDSVETGFDTTPGGIAPVVAWGVALGLAIAAARTIYRRWPRPVAYLVTTPVLLALVIVLFESIGGLLPATF